MGSVVKGENRERNLSKEVYFSEGYFDLVQLASFSHQINEINKLSPKRILEIGVGNGFVSSFLKRAGYEVVTVDINKNLDPDVVSTIKNLPNVLLDYDFDLVVCCEVLEHLPFDEFDESLLVLKRYSKSIFLSLPRYKRWYGFSGFLTIPKVGVRVFSIGFYFNRYKNLENSEHFWEIGSHEYSKIEFIISKLKKHYGKCNVVSNSLNKYHQYFVCGG